jgi:hypothetical protein
MPDPILIGRNAEKIEALAKAHGIARFGTNLDAALANKSDSVFFDAGHHADAPDPAGPGAARGQACLLREADRHQLERGGRGLPPGQTSGPEARRRCRTNCSCPGCASSTCCAGRASSAACSAVRIEFGYWVFEGDLQAIQRPSWNYRAEDGGGIILDMICHWR